MGKYIVKKFSEGLETDYLRDMVKQDFDYVDGDKSNKDVIMVISKPTIDYLDKKFENVVRKSKIKSRKFFGHDIVINPNVQERQYIIISTFDYQERLKRKTSNLNK